MRFPKPETTFKRLARNRAKNAKTRIEALSALERPPVSLLLRILAEPEAPPALVDAALRKYRAISDPQHKTASETLAAAARLLS